MKMSYVIAVIDINHVIKFFESIFDFWHLVIRGLILTIALMCTMLVSGSYWCSNFMASIFNFSHLLIGGSIEELKQNSDFEPFYEWKSELKLNLKLVMKSGVNKVKKVTRPEFWKKKLIPGGLSVKNWVFLIFSPKLVMVVECNKGHHLSAV